MKMSNIKDKVAKSYRWRDFDHFERNADYIDGDFIKAVNDVCRLEKENTELREFKEFTNMMIRRNLNHSASSYEVIMAIDEKLTGAKS